MEISVYIDREIKVDVCIEEIVEAIESQPEPDSTITLCNVIDCFVRFMSKIKDKQIANLTEAQRKMVGEYLAEQSKRYLLEAFKRGE